MLDTKMKKHVLKYANKHIKIAQNFSVQYFGYKIPKNALHMRVTDTCWIYVTDFKQFNNPNYKYYGVYMLDSTVSNSFRPVIVHKQRFLGVMLSEYILEHDLYNTTCIPVMDMPTHYNPKLGCKSVVDTTVRKFKSKIGVQSGTSKNEAETPLNQQEYILAGMYKYKCGGRSSKA